MTTREPSPFGLLVRRMRIAAALSQEELAVRAGLSVRGLGDLERGVHQAPRLETVRLIADALSLNERERADLLAAARPDTVVAPTAASENRASLPALPMPLTRLIGREREVAALRDRLTQDEHRLITLTGPGGVGKTRLALQVAVDLESAFADGVWFVPLAAINDPELVIPIIAQTLGLLETANHSPADLLKVNLRDRASLLLLDNLEQVVNVAPQLAELLAHCRRLTLLATSRESLRIAGEQEFPVAPLALPRPTRAVSLTELAGNDAVALFLQRARAIAPDFALTQDNAPALAEICARLDGLPLAIELAAAWIKVLPPQALLERLTNRLALLSSERRDVPARLRTMRNAIAWSYDLLTPHERAVFRRLSVFVGGCTFEAAEAVLGAVSTWDDHEQECGLTGLASISSLLEKSLLERYESANDTLRFRMLETIREFGLEQLVVSGEWELAHRRLAEWCQTLAETSYYAVFGAQHRQGLARLDAEHDNVRAALIWALDTGEAELAQRLVFPLSTFWYVRGHLTEGQMWAERALASSSQTSTRAFAGAMAVTAFMTWARGDAESAAELWAEAIPLKRQLEDPTDLARALHTAGLAAEDRRDHEEARRLQEEALVLCRQLGETFFAAHVLNALGQITYRQRGNLDHADAYFTEALHQFQQLEDAFGAGLALANRGRVARDRGDFEQATTMYTEALRLHWNDGDRGRIARCLNGLGIVAAFAGQSKRAARLSGAAEALREMIGAPVPGYRGQHERALKLACDALGEQAFAAAWAAGRALPLADVVVEALHIPSSATVGSATKVWPTEAGQHSLTRREVDVLRLLCKGLTNREIAARLFISPRTAQTHVQHVYAKLGVASRAEAAIHAVELSLI
jgi:predicted ATPase/DNA-binding CsgD family transcriptional regulator/DNA-binding XRE family transcriptional regulator